MIDLLIKWAGYTAVFMAGASMLPAVKVRRLGGAVAAAAAFGVASLLLGWALGALLKSILFLPAILTLGLAWVVVPFIVNMALLKIVDGTTGDALDIEDMRSLTILAVAVTAAGALMNKLL